MEHGKLKGVGLKNPVIEYSHFPVVEVWSEEK